jgi:hypothetical protein
MGKVCRAEPVVPASSSFHARSGIADVKRLAFVLGALLALAPFWIVARFNQFERIW